MTDWITASFDAVARITPAKGAGFQVGAVDDFELPGEGLYRKGPVHKTRKEAEAYAAAHTKKTGEKAFVYGEE